MLFSLLQDENLFSLKSHLLKHFVQDGVRFQDLKFLHASDVEHFNYIRMKFIRTRSMKKVSTMEEACKAMNISTGAGDCIQKMSQVTVERNFPGTMFSLVLREL